MSGYPDGVYGERDEEYWSSPVAMEFVVFDANGKEIDSVDPYHGHETQDTPGWYTVLGWHNWPYDVFVPEGGRYEIREQVER